jgi:hypothetical protein
MPSGAGGLLRVRVYGGFQRSATTHITTEALLLQPHGVEGLLRVETVGASGSLTVCRSGTRRPDREGRTAEAPSANCRCDWDVYFLLKVN